jgi:hypothetical protein
MVDIQLLALPNPADPGFPAIVATFFAFWGGAVELLRTRSWRGVQEATFRSGFVATGIGLLVYLGSQVGRL